MGLCFLSIEQKKGNPDNLDGRLTAYAIIDLDPSEMLSLKHPIASAVHNNLLVAQGNYRDQNNLRDFLRSEMGLSLEEGLEEIVERLDGLESALDPQKLREKIESMKEFEDFIPTPAKIVPFRSEEEILQQEGDVFCMGRFSNISNANLSVNSFPILYQACYREQQVARVRNEIERLISQIENTALPAAVAREQEQPGRPHNTALRLLKEFIPEMLYSRNDRAVFEKAQMKFRYFLREYSQQEDVDAIVRIISAPSELTMKHFRLLELYARKIAEVQAEHFLEVQKIKDDIRRIEEELRKHGPASQANEA